MGYARRGYAFITDIHGNMTALQAIVNDIREFASGRGFDRYDVVCLGDSFDGGPDPVGVACELQTLGCVHLRGNHEDYLFDYKRNPHQERYARPLWKFVPWTVSQLGDQLSVMQSLCVEHWSSLQDPFFAVHGALQGNNRVPDFFVHQSDLSPVFTESHCETFAAHKKFYFNGHSHYLGRHPDPSGHDVWFNCGSVGYPFVEKIPNLPDAPLATWVWAEVTAADAVSIFNRRVPYSSDALLRRYVDSGALEQCAPFSYAIVAQSLFNEDVVYPFFQSTKKTLLTPIEMARVLMAELDRQNVFERINRLLRKAGLREVVRFK